MYPKILKKAHWKMDWKEAMKKQQYLILPIDKSPI